MFSIASFISFSKSTLAKISDSIFLTSAGFGRVVGCFGTKIVQQSSYGKIDVSKVSIFRAIWQISSLSKQISGRKIGMSTHSFVTTKLSIVWLAT
jgi:hypothetical protein